MKKAINIRIDETLLTDLDSYAHELERSRTYIIEKAVSTYFDTLPTSPIHTTKKPLKPYSKGKRRDTLNCSA